MDTPEPQSGRGRKIDGLTQKQASFVLAYVQTGNGMVAYRQAYGSKGSDATVNKEVKKLLAKPVIIDAIKQMRLDLQERAEIQVSDVIRELWDNAMKAKEAEPLLDRKGNIVGYTAQLQASNAALIAVGKHLGAFEGKPGGTAMSPLEHLSAEQREALRLAVEAERERRAAAAAIRSNTADGSGPRRTLQ